MRQQSASRADIEERLSARVFLYEIEILLDLLMDRGLEAIVIKLQVAAPAVEVLRVVIQLAGIITGRRRRHRIIALVAFVNLLSRKVFTHVAQRTFAEQAVRGCGI